MTLVGDRWRVGERHFGDPIEVLVAATLAEVLPVMRAAEAAAEAGFWVVGFVSYQAAPAFSPPLEVAVGRHGPDQPLAWFGVYEESGPVPEFGGWFQIGGWTAGLSESEHAARLEGIREAITAGDTYQVDRTFPMWADFDGDPAALFRAMMAGQPQSYGGLHSTSEPARCCRCRLSCSSPATTGL